MIIPLTPVYDRSRVLADWTCPRKRWWQYEFDGTGIVKNSSSLELFTGTVIHDALATIASLHKESTFNIDILAKDVYTTMFDELMNATAGEPSAEQFSTEQATLAEGMIRGFYKHVWPRLIEEYPEILFIEKEMTYYHGGEWVDFIDLKGQPGKHYTGLIFMSKGDLIMRNNDEVVYIEYKTTRSKRDDWVTSWDTAVQLHSTVKAIEQTTGVVVDKIIVQGLYKGYEFYGKQTSPFCYAYYKPGNPPFTEDQISYEYRQGLRKFPVWQMDGGVKEWVEKMPETILADQFPRTPPIFVNDELVNAFFRQRESREGEINLATDTIAMFKKRDEWYQDVLDDAFPQKFDACVPAYGRPCEYKRLCHGPQTNPFNEGFVHRTPHHAMELERFNVQAE